MVKNEWCLVINDMYMPYHYVVSLKSNRQMHWHKADDIGIKVEFYKSFAEKLSP